MTSNEIKGRLIILGIKNVDIADKFGVTETSVSRVIRGESTSHRIQQEVAKHLGEPVEIVFPERYQKRRVSPRRDEQQAQRQRKLTKQG